MAAELGIPYDPKDQAGYIQERIKVLKTDKNEGIQSPSDASKIRDYLHSLETGKVNDDVTGLHAGRIREEVQARQAWSL
jgi:antirestriction protein ArdC